MDDSLDRLFIEPFNNLLERLVGFLPHLLIAAIIFIAGLVLAFIVKYIVRTILRGGGIDRRSEKWGLSAQFRKWGITGEFSDVIGRIVFWLLVLFFITLSLNALEVEALNDLLSRFFLYLPNFFVALIIMFLGYILSNFFGRAALVWAVNSGLRAARLISKSVQFLVLLLAVTMALEQLGIGQTAILMLFTILFGGVVLGFSIAFGLGGRHAARKYIEGRLGKGAKEARDEIEHL